MVLKTIVELTAFASALEFFLDLLALIFFFIADDEAIIFAFLRPPNDGASAAAHLRPALILAEYAKPHLWIHTRRFFGQLQARVGHDNFFTQYSRWLQQRFRSILNI